MSIIAQDDERSHTYRAETEVGQGMTFPDLKIHKGYRGLVKRGTKTLGWSNLYSTQERAQQWATAEAKRYRDYRRKNGEGIEDVHAKKEAARKANHRRLNRMMEKKQAMYDLIVGMLSDLDLVPTIDLSDTAEKRMATARGILAYIDTDTQ